MTKVKLFTTFALLHKARACIYRYRYLAKKLGGIKKYGKNTPINLLTILDHNGLDDMLWSLRATSKTCDKVARLIAADFAESVLDLFEKDYPNDKRPRQAIKAARDFANSKITQTKLDTARDAARDATGSATAWSLAARDAAESTPAGSTPALFTPALFTIAWSLAAWSAAGSAAESTPAWSAAAFATTARDTGRDAEQKKQIKVIKRYLND